MGLANCYFSILYLFFSVEEAKSDVMRDRWWYLDPLSSDSEGSESFDPRAISDDAVGERGERVQEDEQEPSLEMKEAPNPKRQRQDSASRCTIRTDVLLDEFAESCRRTDDRDAKKEAVRVAALDGLKTRGVDVCTPMSNREMDFVSKNGFPLWEKWGGRWLGGVDDGVFKWGGKTWNGGIYHTNFEKELYQTKLYNYVFVFTDIFFRTLQTVQYSKILEDTDTGGSRVDANTGGSGMIDGQLGLLQTLQAMQFPIQTDGDFRDLLNRFFAVKVSEENTVKDVMESFAAFKDLEQEEEEEEEDPISLPMYVLVLMSSRMLAFASSDANRFKKLEDKVEELMNSELYG